MSRLLFKSNVFPENLRIVCACINVANENNLPFDIVITSGNDGKHKANSLHFENQALDIRSKNFPSKSVKELFLKLVLDKLGPDYEGFLENEGTTNEHFHFEYDPRDNH